MIPIAVFAILAIQARAPHLRGLDLLSSRRANFGEVPLAHGIYARITFDSVPTRIYFPQGSANDRFYINAGSDERDRASSNPTLFLEHESTQSNGWVDWAVQLETVNQVDLLTFREKLTHQPIPIPKSMQSAGTMVKLLWESGYKVTGDVSPAAARRLRRHEGYAGYTFLKAGWSRIYYWFVDRNGRISDVAKRDGEHANVYSYPISRAERTALRRKSSSRHLLP